MSGAELIAYGRTRPEGLAAQGSASTQPDLFCAASIAFHVSCLLILLGDLWQRHVHRKNDDLAVQHVAFDTSSPPPGPDSNNRKGKVKIPPQFGG